MNKTTLLALMCTSTFALSGCIGLLGVGIGAIADSGKGERAEKAHFNALVKKHKELDAKLAKLPEEMEELQSVHNEWDNLYDEIERYRTNEKFDYKHVGSCVKDKARRNSDRCKKAKEMSAKVARKIADTLHAAIEAEPALGSKFPLWDIAYSQRNPELAAAINVEESLKTLAVRMSEHFAKRVKKAGGTETLARKENTGVCCFAEQPQGDDIKPQFVLSGNADELHIHCAAPDVIASYDRTEKDIVAVDMVNRARTNVQQLPGDSNSSRPSYTTEVAMAQFRKAAKQRTGERAELAAEQSGDKSGKTWRFSIVEVSYSTFKKVGTTARRVGDRVDFDDDIREQEIMTGLAVIDMDAPAPESADAQDADAEEEEAPKPKAKAKKSKAKTKTAQRTKRKKR